MGEEGGPSAPAEDTRNLPGVGSRDDDYRYLIDNGPGGSPLFAAAELAAKAARDQEKIKAEEILNLPENRSTRDRSQVLNDLFRRKPGDTGVRLRLEAPREDRDPVPRRDREQRSHPQSLHVVPGSPPTRAPGEA